MPELPEVETVRRGLEPAMTGAKIVNADIRRPDLRWPFPVEMKSRLVGQTVKQLRRRSKYILADLSGGESLIIHLGMSGRILISGDPLGHFHHDHSTPEKHDHVVLDLDNGTRMTFNDARRFGAMDLCATKELEDHPLLAKLGPEPLGNGFDNTYLHDRFSNKSSPIKSALLDQRTVAGLGNIYVCEALHESGISPTRLAKQVSAKSIAVLVPVIRKTLNRAIEAGGSSLKDHRQTDGELGYFQHSFRVYGREGSPCPTDGCSGQIERIVQSGRSTFYCSQCQR
jgi:formamidopyrimidine-DNA glycosylase